MIGSSPRRALLALLCAICCAALVPTMASAATERGALGGIVTHGGTPVAGVEVRTTGPEELSTFAGSTDAYSFTENETNTLNAELEEGGTFFGTVSDSVTDERLEEVEVCATQKAGGPGHGCEMTDGSGEFEMVLPPGEYEVEFFLPGYATVFEEEVIEGGVTTGITIGLEKDGSIEGTVTDSQSNPIPDSLVCVDATRGKFFNSCAFSNHEGEYAFGEVPPYEYEVEFTGQVCDSRSGCEIEECVLQETCSRPYVPLIFEHGAVLRDSEATIVPVAPGETVGGIDGKLLPGGKIEGTVTLAGLGNGPLAGIEVTASPESDPVRAEHSTTNANGEYRIEGLAETAFVVEFKEVCTGGTCADTYVPQRYPGKAGFEEGDPVAVTAATPQTGIDAAMVETSPTTPAFTTNPVLSGDAVVGSTLECSPGTWSHNPTSIAYSWQRSGATVAGQSGSTYTVTSADEGASLTCAATIANQAGSASATSNAVTFAKAATTGTSTTPPTESVPKPNPVTTVAAPKPGPSTVVGNAAAQGGRATLEVRCTGRAGCEGPLKLVYEEKVKTGNGKTKVKVLTLGSTDVSAAAGATKTLKVKLSAKATSLVKEAGKNGLKVMVTGSGVKSRTLVMKQAS